MRGMLRLQADLKSRGRSRWTRRTCSRSARWPRGPGFATSAVCASTSAQGLLSSVADRRRAAPLPAQRAAPAGLRPGRPNVGLSLDEVRAALDALPSGRTPSKADWRGCPGRGRPASTSRSPALQALRDGLTSCIGCGCLSLRTCALSNPGTSCARRDRGRATCPAHCAACRRPAARGSPAPGRGRAAGQHRRAGQRGQQVVDHAQPVRAPAPRTSPRGHPSPVDVLVGRLAAAQGGPGSGPGAQRVTPRRRRVGATSLPAARPGGALRRRLARCPRPPP